MNEKSRNLLVGLTVAVAIVMLGWMILKFQELPAWARSGYEVHVVMHESGRLDEGADVRLAGIRIGRVAEIDFVDGDPTKGVGMTLVIDSDVKIPGKVNPYIRGRVMSGTALVLVADGKEPGVSRTQLWLPKDESVALHQPPGAADQGGGMLPPHLVDQFKGTLTKLDIVLDAVSDILDKESRDNIKGALAEFHLAAAEMKRLGKSGADAFGKYDKVAEKLSTELDKLDRILTTVEKGLAPKLVENVDKFGKLLTALTVTINKVNSGEGTAGRLLADPKLYNELIDTFATLRKMLEQWQEEGVKMKMK